MNLKKMIHRHEVMLTKLSCLEFDIDKFEELREKGIEVNIKDLKYILKELDKPYIGSSLIKIKEKTGITVQTQEEVIDELVRNGLGNFIITDIASDPAIDFKAIAFLDDNKNKGMSFTGTNFEKMFRDTDDNIYRHLEKKLDQEEAAKMFYKLNKNPDEKIFLYGFSIGGELVSDIYAENYNEVEKAFVLNAPSKKIEGLNSTQIQAFSNSKFERWAIGGDPASMMRNGEEAIFELRGVKNSEGTRYEYPTGRSSFFVLKEENQLDNCIANHMAIPSYEYIHGLNGMFVKGPLEEVYYKRKYQPIPKVKEENNSPGMLEDIFNNSIDWLDKFIESTSKIFKKIGDFIIQQIYKDQLLTDGEEKTKESSFNKVDQIVDEIYGEPKKECQKFKETYKLTPEEIKKRAQEKNPQTVADWIEILEENTTESPNGGNSNKGEEDIGDDEIEQ